MKDASIPSEIDAPSQRLRTDVEPALSMLGGAIILDSDASTAHHARRAQAP